MKLQWKEKKKECDTEQQGACLKTQFKPPMVVQFSCAGRGSSSSWIQAKKKGMTEPQAWFQCQGLSRSRSLGLAPFSLTAANRVILTSLWGRQAAEVYGLVLQQQLSTRSKLGCRVIPVIPIVSPVLVGPVPKGRMLEESGWEWSCWGPSRHESKVGKPISPQGHADVFWFSSVSCFVP